MTGIASATLQVEVQSAGGTATSAPVTVPVAPFSPGIFTQDQNGRGPGTIVRASDLSKICPPARFDCAANPAVPGEAVTIFATGLGVVDGPWSSGVPAQSASATRTMPMVTIGGVSAQVLSSGLATGTVGIYRVTVMVPADAPTGDDVPLSLTIGGMASNQVTIAVGPSAYRQAGGPPGASATSIAIDSHNSTLYVGTGGGVFKSTNAGQSWTAASIGLGTLSVRLLSIDPLNGVLYAVTFSGLFKSMDGGGSWLPTNVPLFTDPSGRRIFPGIAALAVDPQHNVYAGTGFGLFKSTDGGATWNPTGLAGTPIWALCADPKNPGTLYAAPQNGLVESTDGGATWNPVNNGLTSTDPSGRVFTPSVQTIAIAPSNSSTLYLGTNNGVFKSTDAAANWTAINNGLTSMLNGRPFLASVTSMAIDPVDSATVYAGIFNGIVKTTDGGANWNAASTGITSSYVPALAIDPAEPDTIFALSLDGVFKSTDRAASWNVTNHGITGASVHALAITSSNAATLFAGTDGFGLFKSTDGGASWMESNSGLTGRASTLVIDPSNPAIVYAGTTGLGNGLGGGNVFKSVNGGTSWTRINNGLGTQMTGVRKLVIAPSDPSVLYLVTGSGFRKSTDAGASWTAPDITGLSDEYPSALAVDPTNSAILYAGTFQAGLLRSTDGAASWTRLKSAPSLPGASGVSAVVIDPDNPTTIYFSPGLAGAVYKSTDSGETWTAANVGLPAAVVSNLIIDPANPSDVYALTGTGLFKSANAGASWISVNSGLPYSIGALAISSTPDSVTLYVGTIGAGVLKSTDGGASWQPTGAN
jgi:uncharacterized protein (TIGR03437 family)